MDVHLLDTCFVSALANKGSKHYASASGWEKSIVDGMYYLGAPTLGELDFGKQLALAAGTPLSKELTEALVRIKHHMPVAPVTNHTAEHYGRLKSAIALAKMPKALAAHQLSKPETWVDEATGLSLGIDENDLWLCAIARERNFNLVTFDSDMLVAQKACPELRLTLLS